jgi:hypothetical protein
MRQKEKNYRQGPNAMPYSGTKFRVPKQTKKSVMEGRKEEKIKFSVICSLYVLFMYAYKYV